MKKLIPALLVMLVIGGVIFTQTNDEPVVSSFDECVSAGNPVMESYPRQCRNNDQHFVEDIGNVLEKSDLIRSEVPYPNQEVTSPLTIKGEARGYWFFEATMPIEITAQDGTVLHQDYVSATGDWMTEDFVPFERTITFDVGDIKKGYIRLKKNNPSDLSELDDELVIPVSFK